MTQSFATKTTSAYRPIGAYLVEAGLLTDAQVGVALADQSTTAMPFGEIVVARGWVKEQTVEFIMEKVVVPERAPQTASGMQDCLTRRRRPVSGQPTSAASNRSPADQGGISWIG